MLSGNMKLAFKLSMLIYTNTLVMFVYTQANTIIYVISDDAAKKEL